MSATIGSNTVYFTCDWYEGCDEKTMTRYYTHSTSEAEGEARQNEHWYISMTDDKCYCPKHSPYNQGN